MSQRCIAALTRTRRHMPEREQHMTPFEYLRGKLYLDVFTEHGTILMVEHRRAVLRDDRTITTSHADGVVDSGTTFITDTDRHFDVFSLGWCNMHTISHTCSM